MPVAAAVNPAAPVTVVDRTGHARTEKISQVLGFHGLNRMEVDSASAGDIVAFAGIEIPAVSDTSGLCPTSYD